MSEHSIRTFPDNDLGAARRGAQASTASPPRVLFWGSYDLGKPRTRILRDGLREIGIDVIEIHADIWSGQEDKSQAGRLVLLQIALRALLAYPRLIWRYLRAPRHDIVIVPYLGQIDVLILWPFARLRGRRVVWDMFISLYDTVVQDRQMAGPKSLTARTLKVLEWLSCRAADLVLIDTPAHARRMAQLFSLRHGHVEAVPVGAEPEAFANVPAHQPHDGPVRILFYGQLIPLHGIDTILKAALSDRGRAYDWHLIGSGQHSDLVRETLADQDSAHIRWEPWRDYNELRSAIAEADICLGIFGGSDKAASVIPNKVYQTLVAGRPVVTRRSPAMEEAFAPHPGLELVAPSDPEALLDGIARIVHADFPTVPQDNLQAANPGEIAQMLMTHITPLIQKSNHYAQ